MKYLFILSLSILTIIGCKNKKQVVADQAEQTEEKQEEVAPKEVNENSENLVGVYRGIFPCDDCAGIQTKLELMDDGVYRISSVYLGKSDEVNVKEGRYQMSAQGNTIVCRIDNQIVSRFKIDGDKIIPVDSQANYSGDTEAQYTLRKNQSKISDYRWIPFEIMGTTINEEFEGNELHLTIQSNGSFSASGGCNYMFGSFNETDKRFISFSDIGMSERLCTFEHYDQQLAKALEKSAQYWLSKDGNEMHLIIGKAAPLAKFRKIGF